MSTTFSRKELLEREYASLPTDTTGINWYKAKEIPTDTTGTTGTNYENDKLYDELRDLVNPKFKAWYMKMFFALGKSKVLVIASQARHDAPRDPRRLFSSLLKRHYSAVRGREESRA